MAKEPEKQQESAAGKEAAGDGSKPPRQAAKKPAAKKRSASKPAGKSVAKETATVSKARKAPAKKAATTSKEAPKAASKTKEPKAGSPSKATKASAKPQAKAALQVLRTTDDLNAATEKWRRHGETIALVPTMGALHGGHEALVKKAAEIADHVVASIFVNPTQFAAHEDLDRYPRSEARDVEALDKLGVEIVWAPGVDVMYPDGFTTHVAPGSAAKGLESDFRPHFFGGVATVVAKLFNQVRPRYAVFGEKDYQQLIVVSQLARDLDMGLEIVAVPTVREDDGLALSSRNAYLSERQRAVAPNLNMVLNEVAHAAASGASISHLKAAAQVRLLTLGFSKVDYVEIRDAATLEPYDVDAGRPGRVLGAAYLGRTRLIDNVAVGL